VIVLVDGLPAPEEITAMVPVKIGDVFSLASVNLAVKSLFQTGIFGDVKVSRTGEKEIILTFELTRNLIVLDLRFKGFPVRRRLLLEALSSLREGEVLIESGLREAETEIEEELRRRGFFGAAVEANVVRVGENGAEVIFGSSGWKRHEVVSIEFQGDLVFPPPEIRKRMKTREGKAYVPVVLERDVRKLTEFYAGRGFRRTDVQIADERIDETSGTVALSLRIIPNERISIAINGAKVPAGLIAPIWEERIFEEWGLAEGEARLINYLRKKGYLFAEVKSRLEKDGNELGVIYDIEPGRKYSVENVLIEGAVSFPAEKIKSELAVVERSLFFSLISYDRLFALPVDVESFYRENGFPEVSVSLELVRDGNNVVARLMIEEGIQEKIDEISIRGASSVSAEEIRKGLQLKEGDPFFPPFVQREAQIIEGHYLDLGFRGTRVFTRAEETEKGKLSVVFEIQEGQPYVVNNIYITGNNVTRLSVIKRELRLEPGDRADFSLIQDSERRLDRLGVFSEVRIEEIPVSESGEMLMVKIREGEQNSASIGIGFQSREEVRSLALWTNTFRPRGTAEYMRSNVFGLAAQFSVLGQYSQFEKRFVTSWSQPYLLGLALGPTLLGWYETEDRISFAFERSGVSLNTIMPIRRNFSLITTLRWTRTRLTKLEIEESEIDRELLPYSTALGSLSFIWDNRDDIFNPERGIFFSIVGEVASPLFGTESDYVKTFFKLQWFKPLWPRVNLSITSRLGLGWGDISIPERFFAGGSGSFRGEGFDHLGPRDPVSDKPVGGKAVFVTNAEFKFPLIPAIRDLSGVVFLDIGNVFTEPSGFDVSEMDAAVGSGLRYRTPLGPVRLEIAWKLWDPVRRAKPLFFITIGNVF